MNEQQLAAVKQALEALEMVVADVKTTPTAYEAHRQAITALQSIISQDALDWMAENARELGLSYEPAPVQEPVAWVNHGENRITRATGWDGYGALYTTPPAPQPVPVKTYHDGKPWPVAPKPWVGLTDEEAKRVFNDEHCNISADLAGMLARAIEAKLKEKNHG
jgi:hypothetical protein